MKKIWKISTFILALITTICISLNFMVGKEGFFGNDFIWILILAITYILINNALKTYNKRLYVCSVLFGLITSICAITGHVAEKYLMTNLLISKKDIILILCKLEALFVCITSITIIIFRELPVFVSKIKLEKKWKFFTANKISVLIVALVLLIMYLPYLLYYYPGNVLIDSAIQIMQGLGPLEITTHHPPIHTAIITMCIELGHSLSGSYNFGAFIYTLLQTLTTCFLFSYTIYYMAKKGVSKSIRIVSFLFYALCPTIPFLTITIYKDIPFALSLLALTICMTEIATNLENFVKHKIRIILTVTAVFLVAIFRNNGLYAIILTMPLVMILVKKYKIKVGAIFLSGILLCLIVIGPIYSMFNIEKGSSKEAFSVILQQFARIKTYKENELTDEEKKNIYKYLPVDNIDKIYNPVFADPVKSQASDQAFKEDKITLLKTYLGLALKYPMHTISSFICNSFGYYYPNTLGWGVYTGVNEECFIDNGVDYGIKQSPIIKIEILDVVNEFVNSRNIPIISMFLSIGFLFWIVIFGAIYCIYTKKYNIIIAYIPLLCMWITILASPVYGEPRYVYGIFTCLPLLLGMSLKKD